MSQKQRLYEYLKYHPGASSLEITLELGIVNVTGRVSDLRRDAIDVDCKRREDGRDGYFLRDAPVQMTVGL